MKKSELKELMENTLEQSKALLSRDGFLKPVAFIYYDNNINIIGLMFKNEEDKNEQIHFLGKFARMKKAEAIYIIIESWYVTYDKKDLKIIPSKHPERKECIFVCGECEEGEITIMQKFERRQIKNEKEDNENKEEIVFQEKDTIENLSFLRFSFGIKKSDKDSSKNLLN